MKQFLDFTLKLSQDAGKIVMTYYGKSKSDYTKDIVTNADFASDKFIREAISKKYLSHAIRTEESTFKPGNEYEWCIDPIDGTNNFSRKDPHFGISIGLKHNGTPIVGAINFPALKQTFYAAQGLGSYVLHDGNAKKLKVSDEESLNMFNISFSVGTFLKDISLSVPLIRALQNTKLFKTFRGRMFESTTYDLCQIANGVFDAHINNIATQWDVTAGDVIVREAGGKTTDLGNRMYIASNGIIHDELVDLIRKHYRFK